MTNKTFKSPLTFLLLTTFFSMLGMTINTPAIPIIAQEFQMNPEDAWGIMTYFAIPGAVSAFIAGALGDYYGRKKIIVFSLILFAFGGFMCFLSTSYKSLLIGRVIQGIGAGPLGVLNTTLATDFYPPEDRPKVMGYISMVALGSTALCPMLGGIIAEWSWRVPFTFSLFGLILAYMFLKFPIPSLTTATNWHDYFKLCKEIFSQKHFITILVISIFFYFSYYGPIVTYFPILANVLFQASPSTIGTIILCGTIFALLSAASADYIARKFSFYSVLLSVAFVYILAHVCMLFINSVWLFVFPIAICSMMQGCVMPLLNVRVSLLGKGDAGRGIAMASKGTCFRLSQALSPLMCGVLWAPIGPMAPMLIGIISAIFMFLLVFFTIPRKNKVFEI